MDEKLKARLAEAYQHRLMIARARDRAAYELVNAWQIYQSLDRQLAEATEFYVGLVEGHYRKDADLLAEVA